MKKLIIKSKQEDGCSPWVLKRKVDDKIKIARKGVYDPSKKRQKDSKGRPYKIKELAQQCMKVIDPDNIIANDPQKEPTNGKRTLLDMDVEDDTKLTMAWFMKVTPCINLKKICEIAGVSYTKVGNAKLGRCKLDRKTLGELNEALKTLIVQ